MGIAIGRNPYFSSRKALRSGQPSLVAEVTLSDLAVCARAGVPTKRVTTPSTHARVPGVIERRPSSFALTRIDAARRALSSSASSGGVGLALALFDRVARAGGAEHAVPDHHR